jgi:hypothetical protein
MPLSEDPGGRLPLARGDGGPVHHKRKAPPQAARITAAASAQDIILLLWACPACAPVRIPTKAATNSNLIAATIPI